jgi:hypothetical protein
MGRKMAWPHPWVGAAPERAPRGFFMSSLPRRENGTPSPPNLGRTRAQASIEIASWRLSH